jgi:hypothetical protein
MKIAFLALALTACAAMEPESPARSPEDACGAARVADLVGRTRSDSLVEEVARRTGARRIRWIRPGDVVTMDYSPDRLNVHLDARDRIERFACG